MEIKLSDVGKLVVLPIKESWGPGKIMKIEAGYAFIRFRDDGDKMMKKYTIGNNPLKWAPEQSDSELDEISSQPAKRRKGPAPVAHLTLAQALEFFTAKYPQGFTDPAYLGNVLKDEKGHHDFLSHLYKDAFGDGRLETLLDNRDYDTLSGKALTLLTAQDLLGRDDLKAFRDSAIQPFGHHGLFRGLEQGPEGLARHPRYSSPLFRDGHGQPGQGFRQLAQRYAVPLYVPAQPLHVPKAQDHQELRFSHGHQSSI